MTNYDKKYPHLPDEDNRLRALCYEQLVVEYDVSPASDITERLDNELASISASGLSGVLLILHNLIVRSGLKRHEIANRGTFGASFVGWLCGLTPFNPLKTVMPLYPELCYGFNWDKEPDIQISVPDGQSEVLYEMLKGIEGVGDVVPLHFESKQDIAFGRCIVPVGESSDPALCLKQSTPYFVLIITTMSHLHLLGRCVELTGIDPENISLEDRDVLELFQHTDHPACIEVSPYRLSAIGLLGIRNYFTLTTFYGNINIPLHSFADLVRIDALGHAANGWVDNQERPVFEQGIHLDELITSREDVYEFCLNELGLSRKESFTIMERVRKGCGVPDELIETVSPEKGSKLEYLNAICDKITYLFPRAHSYEYMVIAWKSAWYRLHYPLEFYHAYFECVADPKIARAIFTGREAYDRIAPYNPEEDDQEFHKKFDFDVDLAVADEMYFRGIDLLYAGYRRHIPYGFSRIHDLIFPGQVSVLAGRPGMGKTSLACDLVSISNRQVMPAYITLYEDSDSIIERIADRGDPCVVFTSLKDAFELLENSDLPAPAVVLDYVPCDEREDHRELFERLKAYAQEHDAPVLVISQVPRKIDKRKNKRPLLQDLPMQYCLDLIDNVIMLYREDYYTGESTGTTEAIIVKSPSGEKTIPLSWDAQRATFL